MIYVGTNYDELGRVGFTEEDWEDCYTLYHTYGVKIGATIHYPKRCYDQKFKDGEFGVHEYVPCILGPEYVGIVEREWQRYYGYKEDYVSYAYSISVSELWNPEIGRVGGKAGGKAGGAAAMAKQLANRTHSSQTGKTPFHTGAAGRASAASPNHSSKTGRTGWKTGAAGRASIASQLANEKHVSQTKKSPFHTGAAGRASASSPNRVGLRSITCPLCGKVGGYVTMKRWHFGNCYLIPRLQELARIPEEWALQV